MKQVSKVEKPIGKISSRVALSAMFISLISMLTIVFSTTPKEVGPSGVTIFFLLMYVFSISVLEIFYRLFISKNKHWQYWLKAIYAAVPVAVIALSSLQQLSSVDLMMALILLTAVTIYHNRNS